MILFAARIDMSIAIYHAGVVSKMDACISVHLIKIFLFINNGTDLTLYISIFLLRICL